MRFLPLLILVGCAGSTIQRYEQTQPFRRAVAEYRFQGEAAKLVAAVREQLAGQGLVVLPTKEESTKFSVPQPSVLSRTQRTVVVAEPQPTGEAVVAMREAMVKTGISEKEPTRKAGVHYEAVFTSSEAGVAIQVQRWEGDDPRRVDDPYLATRAISMVDPEGAGRLWSLEPSGLKTYDCVSTWLNGLPNIGRCPRHR